MPVSLGDRCTHLGRGGRAVVDTGEGTGGSSSPRRDTFCPLSPSLPCREKVAQGEEAGTHLHPVLGSAHGRKEEKPLRSSSPRHSRAGPSQDRLKQSIPCTSRTPRRQSCLSAVTGAGCIAGTAMPRSGQTTRSPGCLYLLDCTASWQS